MVVPAWSVEEMVTVPLDSFPEDIKIMLHHGKRLHALANLAANNREELMFKNWEPE